jgi:hypothetical protein
MGYILSERFSIFDSCWPKENSGPSSYWNENVVVRVVDEGREIASCPKGFGLDEHVHLNQTLSG